MITKRPGEQELALLTWLAEHPTITVVCRDRSDLSRISVECKKAASSHSETAPRTRG